MNWRTKLPGARISETHASAIVVTRTTTEAGSAEAHSTSAAGDSASTRSTPASASGVSATTETTPAKSSTTPAVARCPASVSQGDRCDAD